MAFWMISGSVYLAEVSSDHLRLAACCCLSAAGCDEVAGRLAARLPATLPPGLPAGTPPSTWCTSGWLHSHQAI